MARLIASVLVLVVVGCTDSHTIDGPIDYHVTGGFGPGLDLTRIHLELDGSGTRTDATGSYAFVVERDALARIHDTIYRALPRADHVPACCDFLIDTISVHVDGGRETLATAQGADGEPHELVELADLVRSLGPMTLVP